MKIRPVHILFHLVEAAILLVTTVAFWHHSPPIRDNWVWLIGLAVPVFGLRLLLFGRLWTHTPLLILIAAFLLLTPLNYALAPYQRASYIVLVCRPLLGAWIVVFCVEHARVFRRMDALLVVSLSIGAIVAGLALTASQWNDKIAPLKFLVDALPRMDSKLFLPDMLLSFNPNEIAGAIAWLCPLAAGIALYANSLTAPRPVFAQSDETPPPVGAWHAMPLILFFAAIVICLLLFFALFLGQSRFALMGVIGALGLIVLLGVQARRWRYGLLALLVLVAGLQVALVANLLPVPGKTDGTPLTLNDRDQESVSSRLDMWQRALTMTRDYPFTGVGMAMYRTAIRNPAYQIPLYEQRDAAPPHAHNEWMQIAADLGVPGLLLFLSWQGLVAWFLWRAWRSQDVTWQALTLAIGGGWLAHGLYALGDAVTLWDRYQFVFWWMLGLAAALDAICRAAQVTKLKPDNKPSESPINN